MLLRLILLTTFLCFITENAKAEQVFIGKKFNTAGEDMAGFCRLINHAPCKKKETDKTARELLISAEADIASLPSSDITKENDLLVLLPHTTDQSKMLAATKELSEEDGFQMILDTSLFLRTREAEKRQYDFLWNLINLPQRPHTVNFRSFVKLEREYPLHPALVKYSFRNIDKPSSSRKIIDCDDKARNYYKRTKNKEIKPMVIGADTLGMGIVPYLMERTKSDDPEKVLRATGILLRIKSFDTKVLVPMLFDLLGHPDENIQERALALLGTHEPPLPEVIQRLKSQALEEPVPLEDKCVLGYESASHLVSQAPKTHIAAEKLLTLSTKEFLKVMKEFVTSDNELKLRSAIELYKRYFSRNKLKKIGNLSLEERKVVIKDEYPVETQEVLAFLEGLLDSELPLKNRKRIFYLIAAYRTSHIPHDIIASYAGDLKSKKKACNLLSYSAPTNKHCGHTLMEHSSYAIKMMHSEAAIPEVFSSIEHLLSSDDKNHRSIAYQLLSNLSLHAELPDKIIEELLLKAEKEHASAKTLVNIAIRSPHWQDKIISFFEQELKNENKWERVTALHTLAEIAKETPDKKEAILETIVKAIHSEEDIAAITHALKALTTLLLENKKVEQELLNFQKEAGRIPYPVKGNQEWKFPISFFGKKLHIKGRSLFNIRKELLWAYAKLDNIPQEMLVTIRNNYVTGISALDCQKIDRYRDTLIAAVSTYKKHNNSVSELLPATLKTLSRNDPKCRSTLVFILRQMKEEANAAIPILESQLNKYDNSENGHIFSALKGNDSAEAEAFKEKYANLSNSRKSKKLPTYDFIKSIDIYYSVKPIMEIAEVHAIAVEHSKDKTKPQNITVKVDYPDKPIILMIYSMDMIAWTIEPSDKTNIVAIWLGGQNKQIAEYIPEDIPYTGFIGYQWNYINAQGFAGGYAKQPLITSKVLTQKDAVTFQYHKYADIITLNKETPARPPFNLSTHLSNIFDEDGNLKQQKKDEYDNIPVPLIIQEQRR